MGTRFEIHDLGEVKLNVAISGRADRPLIICLHGFPEYWAAWREVMAELEADFLVVAPDQRGFNLSSKPVGVDAYRAKHMVADLAALADRLSPGKPFVLAGHDWGASVAYAFAMTRPERVSQLIIANGVHPVCFQRAIFEDAAQREASQYMNRLRADDAEELLAADGYRRLARMVEGFSTADFFDAAMKRGYLEAWSQPGALTGMLNWYRASPIIVPEVGATPSGPSVLDMPPENFAITMPHLVLWGQQDQALRPTCLDGLETFARDLTVMPVADAGHWILHEQPKAVAEAIRGFVVR
ncbi:MAG TPA: alpha/beta hydrolase [Mycoplana sp.]|nr:alpha/beta hydrolase [Mycoplana sp.]